jgi:hypothetical protein
MTTRTLKVRVSFDPKRTDEEAVGFAVDHVLREAVKSGLFEEYGPVKISPSTLVPRASYVDLEGHIRYRDE